MKPAFVHTFMSRGVVWMENPMEINVQWTVQELKELVKVNVHV